MISPSAQAGKFVISLCSVEVPITVPQPRSPELVRYRFFLHTSWEEGGRRHRLYMGYFPTREEAQKWLGTLRRIYPSAFVAVAPEVETLSSSQIVSLLDQPQSSSEPAPIAGNSRAARQPPVACEPAGRVRSEQTQKSGPSLEDTLNELRDSSALGFNDEDTLSQTGVRHLRIEVKREVPRAAGRSGSRKA
jgi:hypothetical protein